MKNMPFYWILIILALLFVIGAALALKAIGKPRQK